MTALPPFTTQLPGARQVVELGQDDLIWSYDDRSCQVAPARFFGDRRAYRAKVEPMPCYSHSLGLVEFMLDECHQLAPLCALAMRVGELADRLVPPGRGRARDALVAGRADRRHDVPVRPPLRLRHHDVVAYSAGSMVAVAGTPGERYIGRRASHLLHYGSAWAGYLETPLQADREFERVQTHFATILAHYKEHAKIPGLGKEMMDDGFWVTADKCIEWRLADRYLDDLVQA